MTTTVQRRRAVVMGASSGMGREVAMLLLSDGWQVGVAARRQEALDEIKNQFPQQVVCATIDVTADEASGQLIKLIETLGGIDLYFHASGIGKQNYELQPDIELRTVATNGMGFTRMVDVAYGYMAQHGGGHIAVISSIAGVKGLGVAPSYSATKAFQNTYIQALEQQAKMRHLNISFTDIRPGFVATALLDDEHSYPMLMDPKRVAKKIVKAVRAKKHVAIIDWRYRLLVAAWRRLPKALWRHLKIKTKS